MIFPMMNAVYFYIITFRSTCALTTMAVFCSSLTSCSPRMLLRYFLNYFEMIPVALFHWYHIRFYIPHAMYFCCKVFVFWNFLSFFFS